MVTKHIFAELSLIKSEAQVIVPSKLRLQSENKWKNWQNFHQFYIMVSSNKNFQKFIYSQISLNCPIWGWQVCKFVMGRAKLKNLSHKLITQVKQLLSPFHSLLRHTYKLRRLTTFLSRGSPVHSLRCYHRQRTDIESPIEILQGWAED